MITTVHTEYGFPLHFIRRGEVHVEITRPDRIEHSKWSNVHSWGAIGAFDYTIRELENIGWIPDWGAGKDMRIRY